MTRTRLWAAILVAIAIGSVAGWLRPLPTLESAMDKGSSAGWQLPAPETLERSSVELSSQARALAWVGDTGTGGSAAPQDWILKAILTGEDAILLQSGKESLISRAEVGATLPDGSRLVALRGDTAIIERDGCRMDRPLYPRASDSGSSECKTAIPQKDTQQP